MQVSIRNGYAGDRTLSGPVVVRIRDGKQEPLQHLVYHSPDGFEWGYGGSGPADLARSILADAVGEENAIAPLYQAFKWEYVAGWGRRWEISLNEIKDWLQKKNDLLQQVASTN